MIDAPLSKRWHKFSAGLCKLLLDCYCVDPSRRLSGWSGIRKHIVHKLKFFLFFVMLQSSLPDCQVTAELHLVAKFQWKTSLPESLMPSARWQEKGALTASGKEC